MSETGDPHLRDDVLAAYLDGVLTEQKRASANAHLADCVSCRDELVALSALARSTERPRRLLRLAGPAAAIAAALLIAVLGPWRTSRHVDDTSGRLREPVGIGRSSPGGLRAISPFEGAAMPADSVRFTWRSHAPGAGYRVTVTDDSGAVQWSADTPDTTVLLPDSVRLGRGRAYYWYFDAIANDCRTTGTGLRQFRIAP